MQQLISSKSLMLVHVFIVVTKTNILVCDFVAWSRSVQMSSSQFIVTASVHWWPPFWNSYLLKWSV